MLLLKWRTVMLQNPAVLLQLMSRLRIQLCSTCKNTRGKRPEDSQTVRADGRSHDREKENALFSHYPSRSNCITFSCILSSCSQQEQFLHHFTVPLKKHLKSWHYVNDKLTQQDNWRQLDDGGDDDSETARLNGHRAPSAVFKRIPESSKVTEGGSTSLHIYMWLSSFGHPIQMV